MSKAKVNLIFTYNICPYKKAFFTCAMAKAQRLIPVSEKAGIRCQLSDTIYRRYLTFTNMIYSTVDIYNISQCHLLLGSSKALGIRIVG